MGRKERFGFTLIELLVVISVIAIIAAILFPTFAQAREKARGAACLANLKQIGLATTLYADDYDEVLPWNRGGLTAPRGKDTSAWIAKIYKQNIQCVDASPVPLPVLLQPYLKNVEVLRCPSFRGWVYTWALDNKGKQWGRIGPIGYTFNPVQFQDECRPHPLAWLRHSRGEVALFHDMAMPSGLIWGLDSFIYPFSTRSRMPDGNSYFGWAQYLGAVPDPSIETRRRHVDGYNFAFADGHAQYLRPRQVGPEYTANSGLDINGVPFRGPVRVVSGYFPEAMAD